MSLLITATHVSVVAGPIIDKVKDAAGEVNSTIPILMTAAGAVFVLWVIFKFKSVVKGFMAGLGVAAVMAVTGNLQVLSQLVGGEVKSIEQLGVIEQPAATPPIVLM